MDAQTKKAIDSLTKELLRTQADLATVKRGQRRPQLAHSSIDSGALEVRDSAGVTRLRLGWLPDGTVGSIVEGGDPPPAPTAPGVSPMASGLIVSWDGDLVSDVAMPSDFDHVNVYVSATDGFSPSLETFAGTIHRDGGTLPVAPLEIGTTYYVVLVGVGTGGVRGEPSAQASGVPESVTDIEPGSITEVEIADDAISTPKLRAEAVTALKIAAEAIEAGHIQAAAITASKLESDLVLGTRIIAGNPAGARVELDEGGLRGYTDSDELAFVIDDEGSAVFSGDIIGSEISGSRITIGAAPGNTGSIEDDAGVVRTRVTSSTGQRAQIAATTGQAEFTAWAQPGASAPVGGMVAQPETVALTLQSVSGDVDSPFSQHTVTTGQAIGTWRAGDGSQVQIQALTDWSSISALPAASTVGQPAAHAGVLYAFRRAAFDTPTMSLQSPASASGPGANRRSIIHVEGANTNRAHTIINHAARIHYFQGELVDGSTDTTTDGRVELAPTHSILAPRHAPVRQAMVAQPTETAASGGPWNAFTSGQWPVINFRTGWSGRARITIRMAGINPNTNASSLATSFALSGGSTVAPDLSRSAFIRSVGTTAVGSRQTLWIDTLNLAANSDYVLTPHWRTSGATAWGTQSYDMTVGNVIIVEPLT